MPDRVFPILQKREQSTLRTSAMKKRVLVFSPDADLSKFLLINLEDRFQILRKNQLEQFEQAIKEISPDLVLVDLFTFSADIIKQLDIVRRASVTVPIIALRAYMSLSSEMNKSIDDLADIVFYKPVDVELISQAIEDLLK